MSAPDPESITSRQKEVFMAALELEDAAARAAYLDSACGGDVDLRTRIERLLGLEAESREFLEPAIVPLLRDGIPPPGQTVGYFGDYVLLDEIARGSSGVVFRARQVSLDRVVALKMLKDGPLLTNDADVQRLHSEAKAAASLDHPHILPIYEVGAHEGQPYFSMKLIEGGTLQFRVAEYQRDVRKAVALLIKVARAVHHAHAKGILHRDLKPGNILLDASGEPLIADFGLARKIGIDSSLTMTGQMMGTPLYMSPEQARGGSKELTPATDIYSLGTILYELIEGRRPFQSDDLIELIRQVAEKPAPAPQSPHRALADIAMKCLEKQPAARYTTAGALADDLEAWLDGKLRAPPRWSVRWRWVALAAACAVLAFGFHAVRPTSDHVVTTTADELDPPGSAGLGVSLREAVRDAAPGVRITFATSVFAREGKITLDATK
ncbi:MAG: serine/threonine protein kinase [Verrucomicrobiaceae bacterium]|nr:serine/threonine protein kinase [Verrucomicrobiaceae bacterium]